MRIVGGNLRGRRLAEPKSQNIRPTSDRNRESLFNILSHSWPDHLAGSVLDVFAGTGAVGIEALSRGAQHCTFMEKGKEGVSLIRRNLETLGVSEKSNLIVCDATRPKPVRRAQPADLVFADPPYAKNLGQKAIVALYQTGWIKKGALVLLEEKKGHLPDTLAGFDKYDERQFGETSIGFFTNNHDNIS